VGHTLATNDTHDAAAGSSVLLLVRPEDLSVSTDLASGLPGTVTASTFQGATTDIAVRLDRIDKLVTAAMASSEAPVVSIGDRVAVTIDASRAVWEAA
jgi:ABC-type Fe3+/spermidine/putrescine transport system ATPase subunit